MPKDPESLIGHEFEGSLKAALTAVEMVEEDSEGINASQALEEGDIEALYDHLEPVDNVPVAQASLDKSKAVLGYLMDYKELYEVSESESTVSTHSEPVNTDEILEVADFYQGEVEGRSQDFEVEGSLAYGIMVSTFLKNVPEYNEGVYESVNIEMFEDDQSVYIEMIDDGVGVDSTDGITGGDGGLSTSEWIIEQYGGDLKVGRDELEEAYRGYKGFGIQAKLPLSNTPLPNDRKDQIP